MTVSTNALQQAVQQTLLQNEPNSGAGDLAGVPLSAPSISKLQNEPTPLTPSPSSPQLDIGNRQSEIPNPLRTPFLRDLAPQNAIQLHIASRLADIAHQQNCLSACQSQILQNEAIRLHENQLVRWRQERADHIKIHGYFDKEHPAPEKPVQEPQTPLSLLAHAFSPTLLPHDAPATKRPPVLSPVERYFRYQQTLDTQFLRLLKTYRQLQNEPKSSVDVPSTEHPSAPKNSILQNEPTRTPVVPPLESSGRHGSVNSV